MAFSGVSLNIDVDLWDVNPGVVKIPTFLGFWELSHVQQFFHVEKFFYVAKFDDSYTLAWVNH